MTTAADLHPNGPIIQVRDLVVRYDGQTILDGISLDIHAGEVMVILGGSGCGKSTLLRCLIGSIRPDAGSICILGTELTTADEEQLNQVRRQMGILFQSGALFNSMTLGENVALPLEQHTDLPRSTIDIIVKMKLEMVGLREHIQKMPGELSGGMKKRGGLARAMALDPTILLYDEPSAGLDPVTSTQIDQLILMQSRPTPTNTAEANPMNGQAKESLASGCNHGPDLGNGEIGAGGTGGVTSVVVTHEMDSAFRIADRMAMLDKGRVLMVGDKAEFEQLRNRLPEGLTVHQQIVRQFLRGDADGPITQRKIVTSYAEDLLGIAPAKLTPKPSVIATR